MMHDKKTEHRATWLGIAAALGLFLAAPGSTSKITQVLASQTQQSASKKAFTAASVHAMPGLHCKIYPTGRSPSTGLAVYTDDDGYARFYAVRATQGDAVQRLTLDCTDSAGKQFSYPVDLTSADTFAPRPLDPSKERGIDRPPLKGDPLSYTQSQLIPAGYGLRPDPVKDPAAYSRWLQAASKPGRLLEAKRPETHPHDVTTTTSPWWVGSVLTGAPSYIATEAVFNVPTGVPGGDGTPNTAIAIWNGLGGFGTGSGLIQGGVNVETTPSVATYSTWREYCCGDPDSNGYGGAFIPSPGDQIYSQEWYCDASGNLNINGGYGCTFLYDYNSGAILSCTSATGSPCWSVKALPLCSVSPKTPGCMTLGKAAEFIIEDQSPQVGSSSAFTDFTPTVTIAGSAYSSTTSSYSQTISTDSSVSLLADFTHAETHVLVSLGTTNQTYFSIEFLHMAPLAAANLFASVYNDQQHFTYRDVNNNVQDAWYGTGGWALQQLTQGPSTLPNEFIVGAPGPPAAGDPFSSVYNDQQHFAYRDLKNDIQDVWYGTTGWHLQQITQAPAALPNEYIVNAPGPAALGDPFVSVYNGQQHFTYRDVKLNIQDVWYDGNTWHLQQLTQEPSTLPNEFIVSTPGPFAVGDLSVSVYNDQQHFAYRDLKNDIQDVWYGTNGWHLQQITQAPAALPNEYIVDAPGPAAAGNPFISVYNSQQHFAYRDRNDNVQDVWYDGTWHLQQLTQGPRSLPNEYIVTAPGPAAAGDPCVSVYNDQQHFAYLDVKNNVQDVWYGTNGWHLQQITQGPSTLPDEYVVDAPGPAAAGNPFVSVYNNQQHFTYRDLNNNVQDVWFDGNTWHLQQISQ